MTGAPAYQDLVAALLATAVLHATRQLGPRLIRPVVSTHSAFQSGLADSAVLLVRRQLDRRHLDSAFCELNRSARFLGRVSLAIGHKAQPSLCK